MCILLMMPSVKYRTMVWWKAAALMIAETVSLGVRAFEMHGLRVSSHVYVDFVSSISVCQPWDGSWLYNGPGTSENSSSCVGSSPHTQTLGGIATATGYMIGLFKLRYPHVHNMADAGEILAGPIGREVFGASQVIFITFACASHVLAGMIAFNTRRWIDHDRESVV